MRVEVKVFFLKSLIHSVAFCWLAIMFYWGVQDKLGADPVKTLIHFTGIGALNLLLMSLAITPIVKHFKQSYLLRCRRLIGLYSFFYALCHFMSFIWFELQWNFSLLVSEIVKRPYITVGFAGFLIILLLAITSFNLIKKQLGSKWQLIHNWTYLLVILVVIHFYWSVKADIVEPIIYFLLVSAILWFRRDKIEKLLKKKVKRKT